MRVLVTGGAGFIGSQIVTALTERGHEPVVLDALLPAVHAARRQRPEPAEPAEQADPAGHLAHPQHPQHPQHPAHAAHPMHPLHAGPPSPPSPPSLPCPPLPPDGVRQLTGDVRDAGTVRAALRGVDAVCHQAAMVGLGKDFAEAPDYVSCNDLGTAVLLAGMAETGVGTLLLAGSMVVYGEGRYECPSHGVVRPGPRAVEALRAGLFEPECPVCGAQLAPGAVGEDAPADPRNTYATTKLAQEHLASSWARATGGRAVSLRYHNVYGPGMPRDTPYAGVAAFFRSALTRGESPAVFEDGAQRRDFVHVRDVAEANAVALEALHEPGGGHRPGGFTPYNVGSGHPHTVGELAHALAEACGGPAPVVTGEFRLGDVRHITASSERIATELGWRARTGFPEGVREFAAAEMRTPVTS
ncbi:NAD-dependent epimerase/dehydratase family protein [Streptomyces iconiensis]|uniref:UDP-glucose 4-epimerase n=1 Tax=Streptomyces iconiensis TaxID=1384038 RepID=A0ABT6ZTQ4_9ACTN|nr:NAD-dependent epimerase/dehydratase family protein [Streptomyces iconiensis]MDJ1131833.1 NAD-dependent epimerase/dehydratase family protein [Streptomyces iconiensis]